MRLPDLRAGHLYFDATRTGSIGASFRGELNRARAPETRFRLSLSHIADGLPDQTGTLK